MPTPSTKKKSKKLVEDPLSSSGVSSLSGISSYNIRKISVYKNGDRFHRGVKFVINPRVVKDMEPLLNQINDRIELSHGAKKLFTSDGKMVNSIKELEDGKIYVAASAQFIPMRYGEFTERVWKPPSRKHSPIMSSDRIKTARTRSQDPRQRRNHNNDQPVKTGGGGSGVQRSRSVRTLAEDRKSRSNVPNGSNVNSVKSSNAVPKKFNQPRPKAPPPRQNPPKSKIPPPTKTTTKKPPTPKRKISKKVAGAVAAGVGVAVVGAAALGAAKRPIPTAVSDISTASSIIPTPNVKSEGAVQILEFPEEEKKIDVEMIHRTPTPPRVQSAKKAPPTADATVAKSVSQQPTPQESSEEEDEGHEDDEDVEDDEVSNEDSEEDEESEEEEEDEDEEEEEASEGDEDAESRLDTPASPAKSSSAVSSARSHKDDDHDSKKA